MQDFIKAYEAKEDTYQVEIALFDKTFGPYKSIVTNIGIRPGWYKIVTDLLDKINEYNKEDDLVSILQIKEKFGGLRVYTYFSNNVSDLIKEEIQDLIDEASKKASTTCDICGCSGAMLSTKQWMRTTCEKHNK